MSMVMTQEPIEDGGTYHICLAYVSGPDLSGKIYFFSYRRKLWYFKTYLHVLDPEDLPLIMDHLSYSSGSLMSSCCRQQQWTVALDLFKEVGAGGMTEAMA